MSTKPAVHGIDGRARSWLYIGHDDLAPFLVGYADDRSLQYGRVAGQDVFDLARVDVLATANDHVLGASGEGQVAVVVEVTDVAGV